MSRLPPVPPASKSIYGPGGEPKSSVDVTHRVRHQAQKARQDETEISADDDPGFHHQRSVWMLGLAGAAVGLAWMILGQQKAAASIDALETHG